MEKSKKSKINKLIYKIEKKIQNGKKLEMEK